MFRRLPKILSFATLFFLTTYNVWSAASQDLRRIVLTVTVTDKHGEYVKGLTKDSFAVFEDGKPREIATFDDRDLPAAVGVVFDVSGSINPKSVRAGQLALTNLVLFSHRETDFFLTGVGSEPQLFQDWTRSETDLAAGLPTIPPKKKLTGYTAFYDACYLSIQKLMSSNHGKRVLIVLSDGEDNNSKHTFKDLKRLLETTDVLFYAVASLGDESQISTISQGGQSILYELSAVTGGKSYFPKKENEIGEAFKKIAGELRNQYSIIIRSDSTRTKSKHPSVNVKLKLQNAVNDSRGLKVRSRQHYYLD